MDTETEGFDQWFEALPIADGDSPAEEASPEEAAPVDDTSPIEAVTDTPELPVAEEESTAEADPEPEAAAPAAPDWNDPNNPYLGQAQAWNQLQATLQQAKELKARQDLQNTITELSDGDPDRVQQLNALLAQVATPVSQAAQYQAHRATNSEKAATALLISMKAELDEAAQERVLGRMGQLMQVEGPEVMERLAFQERDFKKQYASALSARDTQIAELQRQLSARAENAERDARGADHVDGGVGNAASAQNTDDIDNFDDWFAAKMAS